MDLEWLFRAIDVAGDIVNEGNYLKLYQHDLDSDPSWRYVQPEMSIYLMDFDLADRERIVERFKGRRLILLMAKAERFRAGEKVEKKRGVNEDRWGNDINES